LPEGSYMAEFAAKDVEPIPRAVLIRELSELISLRERVEQAELAANIYGVSILQRRRARATPPGV
jgi:hypothetical protein